jgi:hypothetical protein
MEQWNSLVRKLIASPRLAEAVFRILSRMRIKEKGKFMQRMGPEYDYLVSELSEQFDPSDVQYILRNDEFFTLTVELQSKYKR